MGSSSVYTISTNNMKKTNVISIIVLLALIVGFVLVFQSDWYKASKVDSFVECAEAGFPVMESDPRQCRAGDTLYIEGQDGGTNVDEDTDSDGGETDMVRVDSPRSGATVSSPLTVSGEARGNWYFEASFPVRLLDANGKELAVAPAQAQGEWMTTEFVPFSVTLTFSLPTTATGTLVLEKDNPSGLPQNAGEVRVPIRFSSSGSTAERTVTLYYYDESEDLDASGNVQCSAEGLVGVERTVASTFTPIQDTIKLLMQGNLTSAERAQGITTEFPLQGVSLTGASLSSGTLTLGFSDPQNRTSGGSCRVGILWSQIEATAKQFDEVSRVEFEPEELFQP